MMAYALRYVRLSTYRENVFPNLDTLVPKKPAEDPRGDGNASVNPRSTVVLPPLRQRRLGAYGLQDEQPGKGQRTPGLRAGTSWDALQQCLVSVAWMGASEGGLLP